MDLEQLAEYIARVDARVTAQELRLSDVSQACATLEAETLEDNATRLGNNSDAKELQRIRAREGPSPEFLERKRIEVELHPLRAKLPHLQRLHAEIKEQLAAHERTKEEHVRKRNGTWWGEERDILQETERQILHGLGRDPYSFGRLREFAKRDGLSIEQVSGGLLRLQEQIAKLEEAVAQ